MTQEQNMMNRRSFFKHLAAFVGGAVLTACGVKYRTKNQGDIDYGKTKTRDVNLFYVYQDGDIIRERLVTEWGIPEGHPAVLLDEPTRYAVSESLYVWEPYDDEERRYYVNLGYQHSIYDTYYVYNSVDKKMYRVVGTTEKFLGQHTFDVVWDNKAYKRDTDDFIDDLVADVVRYTREGYMS